MSTAVADKALVLGPHDAGRPMTPDEFETADYEEGYRYELIRGVLVVTPPPDAAERGPNEYLGHLLLAYQESHPQGAALDATLPEQNIRTSRAIRRADRAIWAGLGRIPRMHGPHRRRDVPTIVVEFPSRRLADQRRDYEEKRDEYLETGIQEYWIIDHFSGQMVALRRTGGKRGAAQWRRLTIGKRATYRTPLLPGFELPLAKLLSVARRYGERVPGAEL